MSNLDLETILGGLYQVSTIFRKKDKYPLVTKWVYPLVTKWVYTHLLINSQYFQITNFDAITMVFEIKKSQRTFQNLVSIFFLSILS